MKIICLFILSSCTHLFYHPTHKVYFTPEDFKIEYEQIQFNSQDGTKLHAWWLKTKNKNSKGTFIYFHGNAQNLTSHFTNMMWIVERGYNLFIFDYRGYGKSQGKPNQKGLAMDGVSALNQGVELWKASGKGKLVAHGQSLGGNVLIKSLSEYDFQDLIDLVILDSTFESYQEISRDKLKSVWFLYPFSFMTSFLISDKYSAKNKVEKITAKTLVITGQNDDVVSEKYGLSIFKKIQSPKWYWDILNGSHIDGFHVDKGVYREELMRILDGFNP